MRILKSNAAINSAAVGISSGLGFVAVFVWTHLLQPHEFGLYTLITASSLILNALTFEWLRLVGARSIYAAGAPFSIDTARANALLFFYAALALTLIVAGVVLMIAHVDLMGLPAAWWPLTIVFTLTEAALALINTVSRVRLRAWEFFRSVVARAVLSLAGGAALVAWFGLGARGVIVGVVASQIVVAVGGLLANPLYRSLRPWHASRDEILATLAFGYPLIASCVLGYGAGLADRFLVGNALGTTAVGLYAAPVDLLQKTLLFGMMTINLTAYPALVRAYEDRGAAAAKVALDNNLLLHLGVGVPAAVGLAVLAPGIARLLLGPHFQQSAVALLPFIALAALLRGLVTYHLAMTFQVTKRMKLMIVPPLGSLALLIPLALVLMPRFGITGMAMASAAAQTFTFLLTAILARRVLPLTIVSADLLRLLAAAGGMAAVLWPLSRYAAPVQTIAAVGVGGAVYVALLLLLGFTPARTILARLGGRRLSRAA